MMSGKPQTLKSKFKISYNLLLNLIDIGDNNFIQFARKSMVKDDLDNELKEIYYNISREQTGLDNLELSLKNNRTPHEVINTYLNLTKNKNVQVNKKRKEMERQIENIKEQFVNIEFDKIKVEKYNEKIKLIDNLQENYNFVEKFIDMNVEKIINLLYENEFILKDTASGSNNITLSLKGKVASQLRECHCLVFSQLFEEKIFDELPTIELIMLLSCLTNIVVKDELRDYIPKITNERLKVYLFKTRNMYDKYSNLELQLNINPGMDYTFHFDLLNYIEKWCGCENVEGCKQVICELAANKEIFLGEFVKSLLKITNICSEFEKIAEITNNMMLLSKLKEVPIMLLKYVVTNQSLYV